MPDYTHGTYSKLQIAANKVAIKSRNAFVYVGTAPVHTVEGGAQNVNRPMVVSSMQEARKYFGYSDEWDKYTLCEAMYVHFEQRAVGPIILINVLDPQKHKATQNGTASLTPANGRVTLTSAGDIMLDSVSVDGKVKGQDYTVQYDYRRKTISIVETGLGTLGKDALSITYSSVSAADVDADDVIGQSDGNGLNTGLYAVKNVYQETGYIPSFLLAPGFSSLPKVHAEMASVARKINQHWDAYVMADIPVVDDKGEKVTIQNAATWQKANGYNQENEKVFFPLARGTDGATYHLSVLAAANLQKLLAEHDGIPHHTASNTACEIIQNIYLGEDSLGRVFDDSIINEKLNKNGITSAAYVGGQWVIWGAHCADYVYDSSERVTACDTNRMMMYYISNDFQHRRPVNVDKPLTDNDIRSIISQEQTRMDALLKMGALKVGKVYVDAQQSSSSDVVSGDYSFNFDVSTTPLSKSLTAIVNWSDDTGFTTYFT